MPIYTSDGETYEDELSLAHGVQTQEKPITNSPQSAGKEPSKADIESMTHPPEQPNPAEPYLTMAKHFAEGGISKVLGENQPLWSKKIGEILSSPESSAAMGTMTPLSKLGPETFNKMLKYFQTVDEMKEMTPLQRAEKLGFTTDAYRGLKVPFDPNRLMKELDDVHKKAYSSKTYTSANPELADLYTKWDPLTDDPLQDFGYTHGANIVPMKLNTENYHTVDAKGAVWADTSIMHEAMMEALENKKSGVIVKNIYDEPHGNTKVLGKPKDVIIPFDPKTVKSKFAKFDPSKVGLADFLAGVGGVSVLSQIPKEDKK